MKNHTPTPWQQHDPDYCPLEIWGNLEGPMDGEIRGTNVCEVLTDEHDAEFIIRACNSFDDLLAACEAALLKLNHNPMDRVSVAADMLNAAIAKAKGA